MNNNGTLYETLRQVYENDLKEVKQDEYSGKVRIKARCWKSIMRYYDSTDVEIDHNSVPSIMLMSDLHFYHSNIIRYADRPYNSVEEMNAQMIRDIRYMSEETPDTICLGDFGFAGVAKLTEIVEEIGKFDLVMGNHDIKRRSDHRIDFPVKSVNAFKCLLEYEDLPNIMFTHYPLSENNIPPGFVNVHGHTHNKADQSDRHFNISWERTDFSPVRMVDLLDKIRTRMISTEETL